MGSKRALLANGLGEVLTEELSGLRGRRAARFIDLFAGAGSVATFAAVRTRVPVHANDLQFFSSILCGAVIERTRALDSIGLWAAWLARMRDWCSRKEWFRTAQRIESSNWLENPVKSATAARRWATHATDSLVRAYGGHYFSPLQISLITGLRRTLPTRKPERTLALAALLDAVSYCSASPGHTAQPFAPMAYSNSEVAALWRRDVLTRTFASLRDLAPRHALARGTTSTADANRLARKATARDLVFVDPPYSAVQYSRFYHVLEAIATGEATEVTGRGRYPESDQRPWSAYSAKSEARAALAGLISVLADREATVVLTFPSGPASNGLSGQAVEEVAAQHFSVSRRKIAGRFSTLGGNGKHRPARQDSHELVLVLKKRRVHGRPAAVPRPRRPSRLALGG